MAEGMEHMSREALMSLQESLDLLEQEDPNVKAQRERLDAAIDALTRRQLEDAESARLAEELKNRSCDDCGVPKFTPHHESCKHYGDGTPTREAGGYQYLNEDMEILHITSVPLTDKAALEYFKTVDSWFATSRLKYIWRRAMWDANYKMMPFEWNRETKEIMLIGGEPMPEGMIGGLLESIKEL